MVSTFFKPALQYFVLICTLFCSSCNFSDIPNEDKFARSHVKQVAGVYVFIMSEPTEAYDKLGDVRFGWYDKFLSLSSKSISQVSADVLASLSFDKNLNNSINEVKLKFPNVEGVIFNDDATTCTAFKFKR